MYDQPITSTPVASPDAAAYAGAFTFFIGIFVFAIISIVAMWKIFTKAGQPGWAAIIPLYNTYILLKIVGRPAWWLVLYLIPLVNLVVSVIIILDLAKAFGKDTVFAIVGLIFFSPIGMMILAFGKSQYVGPATPQAPAPVAVPPATPAV